MWATPLHSRNWLRLRAQAGDATPSNQLIRQNFPLENRSIRLYSNQTLARAVFFLNQRSRTTLAREDSCKVDFELVLRRPIETTATNGTCHLYSVSNRAMFSLKSFDPLSFWMFLPPLTRLYVLFL